MIKVKIWFQRDLGITGFLQFVTLGKKCVVMSSRETTGIESPSELSYDVDDSTVLTILSGLKTRSLGLNTLGTT